MKHKYFNNILFHFETHFSEFFFYKTKGRKINYAKKRKISIMMEYENVYFFIQLILFYGHKIIIDVI
jgi:hypothetical protein